MKEINRILVIRFRRVGDAVLSTTLCSSLKRTFPHATVDYVLNKEIAPLFENHADIDNIITFSKEDMATLGNYLRKVRKVMKSGNYDLIVDTRSTIKTLWFSFFSLKTPYRIGKKKSYNALLHNYRVECSEETEILNDTLKLLQPLEKFFPVKYDWEFRLYATDAEKKSFAQYLQSQGVDLSRPIILCAAATRIPFKMWKEESMKEILQRIVDQYKEAQIILNYAGKDEQLIVKQIHEEMQWHPRVFSTIEANNLRELAAMTSFCSFFFGNEGGPRHIAQALNVPSLAIYPPNVSKARWLPNASERFQGIESTDILEQAKSKQLSYTEEFEIITVEEVWKRLSPMLDIYLR